MNPAQKSLRSRFLEMDTTTVSDVLGLHGRFDQALATDLLSLAEGQPRLAGFAYTVRTAMLPYPCAPPCSPTRGQATPTRWSPSMA